MPTSLEPLLQLVSGVVEAITPFALGRSARVQLLAALTPIADRLKKALAQTPFGGQGQHLLGLEAEVQKLADVALQSDSNLPVALRKELEDFQHSLKGFLLNASSAGYSEGYAVLSQVRHLQDELR